MGVLEQVYALETRPYNQGSRLTAYEIMQDPLPGTLICDSMAAAAMALKDIDCVVVGADRVAANGDTANKIGTYQLSILSKYHNIAYVVASPTTTLDPSLPSGQDITIEERPGNELACIGKVRIAPEGIKVWNPAFDVAPAKLISCIVTEKGLILPQNTGTDKQSFDIASFMRAHNVMPQGSAAKGSSKL